MQDSHFIAVINNQDYPITIIGIGDNLGKRPAQQAAEQAVKDSGLKTKRSDPQRLDVEVYAVSIEIVKKDGKKDFQIIKKHLHGYSILPEIERMTEAEYIVEVETALAGIPDEFHNYVKGKAWEGIAKNDYEIAVERTEKLAMELQPSIRDYYKGLRNSKTSKGFEE